MSDHERRLDRLTVVYHRPDPVPGNRWDNSALMPREQYELAQLLERCRPSDRTDHAQPAEMSALSDEERARLADLMTRVVERSPQPAI